MSVYSVHERTVLNYHLAACPPVHSSLDIVSLEWPADRVSERLVLQTCEFYSTIRFTIKNCSLLALHDPHRYSFVAFQESILPLHFVT